MFQKLPEDGFKVKKKTSEFNESFIKNYDEDSDKGHILKVDVKCPKRLYNIHSNLPFLPDRIKIKKCNKCVCNLYEKKYYVLHIRALKQALNHCLVLKKIHRVIQFNQEAWLNPDIYMNTKLRKEAKMNLKEISLS